MYVCKYLRYNKLDENSVHGIEILNVCMYVCTSTKRLKAEDILCR